jgi:hypothetical protein
MPLAANSRSERSCRVSFLSLNSVAEALRENASITGKPLLRSGGFRVMGFISWASMHPEKHINSKVEAIILMTE